MEIVKSKGRNWLFEYEEENCKPTTHRLTDAGRAHLDKYGVFIFLCTSRATVELLEVSSTAEIERPKESWIEDKAEREMAIHEDLTKEQARNIVLARYFGWIKEFCSEEDLLMYCQENCYAFTSNIGRYAGLYIVEEVAACTQK